MHTCPQCSKEFHGKSTRVYCSMECRRKAPVNPWNKGKAGIAANRPKNGASKKCEYCDGEFYVPKHRLDAKFCSMSCYHKSRWAVTGTCHNCGQPSEGKFCAPECQKDYWHKNGWQSHKARLWDRKKEVIASLGGKCVRCGNSDIRVLDINHIDRDRKDRHKQYSWLRRLKDWEKHKDNIELLCANCHRIHTWEQMGYGIVNGNAI